LVATINETVYPTLLVTIILELFSPPKTIKARTVLFLIFCFILKAVEEGKGKSM